MWWVVLGGVAPLGAANDLLQSTERAGTAPVRLPVAQRLHWCDTPDLARCAAVLRQPSSSLTLPETPQLSSHAQNLFRRPRSGCQPDWKPSQQQH